MQEAQRNPSRRNIKTNNQTAEKVTKEKTLKWPEVAKMPDYIQRNKFKNDGKPIIRNYARQNTMEQHL